MGAMTERIVKVAIIQDEVAPTLEEGLRRTRELATKAAHNGASLIAFPETWLPGYPSWLDWCRDAGLWDHKPTKQAFARMAAHSIDVRGDSGRSLAQIARDLSVTLVTGVTERVDSGPGRGTLYNSLLTYGPEGALLNHHRKLVPTYTERLVWGPGDTHGLQVVATPAGRVGGLVCWEHWMPFARQALHNSGEDIHIAVWPTVHEMHQVASRHYAFEGRCFVLAAGSLMYSRDLPPEFESAAPADAFVLRGGSAIIAPDGSYVAGPVYEKPAIVAAEIDLQRVREEQMTLDVAGHYSRPDAFTFAVTPQPRA
jgi:predicted amidohydrolase